MKRKSLAVVIGLSAMILSCSTTTHFNSTTPVDVYVDGEYIGRTPNASVSLSDAVWGNPSCYAIDEAGNTYSYNIQREVKVGAVIGGFFLWPIWLWTYGPKPEQMIVTNNNKMDFGFVKPQPQPQPQPQTQNVIPQYQATQQNSAPQPAGYFENNQPYYVDQDGYYYYYDVNGQVKYFDPSQM